MKGLLILLLIVVSFNFSYGQKYDTTKVIILYCDTSNSFESTRGVIFWKFGYSVRELRNTSEGVMDAGGQICIDNNGNAIPCWNEYWQHLFYLDARKKPLPKSTVIFQDKPTR